MTFSATPTVGYSPVPSPVEMRTLVVDRVLGTPSRMRTFHLDVPELAG
jgi:hypothetical protein